MAFRIGTNPESVNYPKVGWVPGKYASNYQYGGGTPAVDSYGQYDRGLDHGFGGAQFSLGGTSGSIINYEC
mgnify:CR=1 FL=1